VDAFLDSVGTKGCYYYYREEGVASEEVGVYKHVLCTVAKTCKKHFFLKISFGFWICIILEMDTIDPCSFIFDFGYMPVPSTIVCMYLYLND